MRLSILVNEKVWKRLRDLAEERRSENGHGRASVSALVGELIRRHLTCRQPKAERGGGAR